MEKIEIVLSASEPIPAPSHTPPSANPHLGWKETFTDDLVLKQYNRKKPEYGLPNKEEDRLAGIHSGTLTVLRKGQPGDRFYQPNTYVVQYEATYKFCDLPKTPLKKGQITAQRLVVFVTQPDRLHPLQTPNKFATLRAREEETHNATVANDRVGVSMGDYSAGDPRFAADQPVGPSANVLRVAGVRLVHC